MSRDWIAVVIGVIAAKSLSLDSRMSKLLEQRKWGIALLLSRFIIFTLGIAGSMLLGGYVTSVIWFQPLCIAALVGIFAAAVKANCM